MTGFSFWVNFSSKQQVGLRWRFYLCGQRLDRLQVEVVVEMQVVEVLTVDKQIEHVVALPANLQTHFHPVQLGGLKELRGLEGAEQIPERQNRGNLNRKTDR